MNGYEVASSRTVHRGRVITLHTDQVRVIQIGGQPGPHCGHRGGAEGGGIGPG